MNKELMMKRYKFCELMKLMPYANEAANVRPNQLLFNVEKQRGARDGIQRVNDNPELAAGVYYLSLIFEGKRWDYIGESSINIFARLASHCLKLFYRTPNPWFRRCLSETYGQLTQHEIREMFDKKSFNTQFDIGSFIMDETFAMKDEMLSLGRRIAKRYPTIAEQKMFAESIQIKTWEPPRKFQTQELSRAITRLIESYFLRLYFTKKLRLPLLNLDDDQSEQIANRRLDDVNNLYDLSQNDPYINSILETVTKTFE